jgi:hypothetical protein
MLYFNLPSCSCPLEFVQHSSSIPNAPAPPFSLLPEEAFGQTPEVDINNGDVSVCFIFHACSCFWRVLAVGAAWLTSLPTVGVGSLGRHMLARVGNTLRSDCSMVTCWDAWLLGSDMSARVHNSSPSVILPCHDALSPASSG